MAPESGAPDAAGIVIRDCTLREGRDVPGVEFSVEQAARIARLVAAAGVPEIEVVAPGRVMADVALAERLRAERLGLRIAGLVYAASPRCREDIAAVSAVADCCDLLMPLAKERAPHDRASKRRVLEDAIAHARGRVPAVGAGFPHATQAEPAFLLDMCQSAEAQGAQRLMIYDTNGSADPFAVFGLVRRLKQQVGVSVFFHAHNDLGLATANAYAAVRAGADGVDVTVNGIGDRAGNASLEQIAMLLHLRGCRTGVALSALKALSECVALESGVGVSRLAPVVGDFAATHKSPGHMEALALFEAFDLSLVRLERKIGS
jgi:homocitrate synthase NifV